MSDSGVIRRAYADTGKGQLHYRIAGEMSNPPVLLLHQTPSTSAMFMDLMECLSGHFLVIAPDTPGFGNSDPLIGEVSVEKFSVAIKSLVDALGLPPCHVFGHHTGASIAVQLEHDYPGTSRTMTLSGPPLLTAEQQQALPMGASTFPVDEQGSHLLKMWQRLRAKDSGASLVLSQRELLSAFASGSAYQASYEAVCRQDFAGQLAAIRCPVLVFAGSCDPLCAAVEPTIACLQVPRTLKVPEGAGTYICEQQAGWLAEELGKFYGTN